MEKVMADGGVLGSSVVEGCQGGGRACTDFELPCKLFTYLKPHLPHMVARIVHNLSRYSRSGLLDHNPRP